VNDTENFNWGREDTTFLQRVVLPAPEGAETIKSLPLLLFSCKGFLSIEESLGNGLCLDGGQDYVVAVGHYDRPGTPPLCCVDELPAFCPQSLFMGASPASQSHHFEQYHTAKSDIDEHRTKVTFFHLSFLLLNVLYLLANFLCLVFHFDDEARYGIITRFARYGIYFPVDLLEEKIEFLAYGIFLLENFPELRQMVFYSAYFFRNVKFIGHKGSFCSSLLLSIVSSPRTDFRRSSIFPSTGQRGLQ
jgi:hypothetical protein